LEFKLGDKVNWLGLIGYVDGILDTQYCIVVKFNSGNMGMFTKEGCYFKDQEPSLELIERKKESLAVEIYLDNKDKRIYLIKENVVHFYSELNKKFLQSNLSIEIVRSYEFIQKIEIPV